MPDPDRRRLVPLRLLEPAIRRAHPLSPVDWAAARRHARKGTEAPEELRPAVRADADAILHSSDLGIAPVVQIGALLVLAVLTVVAWLGTANPLTLLAAVVELLIAGGAVLARKLRRARAETALLRNADPL